MEKYKRDELIKSNIGLAFHIAKQYMGSIDLDDLCQVSIFGLMDAAEHYDPEKGVPFSSFAGVCIKNRILRELSREDKNKTNLSLYETISVDESGNALKVEDVIEDVRGRESLERIEIRLMLQSILSQMAPMEKKMILMYISGARQADIGKRMGISQSCVSKLLKKTFEKMRRSL